MCNPSTRTMLCMYVTPGSDHEMMRKEKKAGFANSPFQFWLLGYEFPTTLMLFTLDTLYILTTAKKGALVEA